MSRQIAVQPLTVEAFAPFGEVIEVSGAPDKIINQGLCGRYHDRAALDFGPQGRAGISVFDARARALPYELEMMERHPEGSQAFIPMHGNPFLVIVAADEAGRPGTPGFCHQWRAGHQCSPQHLAWRADPAGGSRPVRGDRPDRRHAKPSGTLVRHPLAGDRNRLTAQRGRPKDPGRTGQS